MSYPFKRIIDIPNNGQLDTIEIYHLPSIQIKPHPAQQNRINNQNRSVQLITVE